MTAEFPQVEGVEHRFVDANGIRVHVAEAGPQDPQPPILLLHGWPQHWYMWRRVIAALRSEYRLLAPDLRGFGWTEAPGHGYDGETFAADQVALLDALGIERACVIGHDWGGWTAMLLGLLHPDRVERMLVCNAPHPWPRVSPRSPLEAWRSWYTWVIATARARPVARSSTAGSRAASSPAATSAPRSRDAELELYVDSFREPRAPTRSCSSIATTSVRCARPCAGAGATRGSRCPPCFCSARATATCRRSCSPATSPTPTTCGWSWSPDSGHFIVDERPELVIERAREFLLADGLQPSSSGGSAFGPSG